MAASRQGTAHARAGSRRQDAMAAFAAHEGKVIVAIACDGCGSATHGRTGAKLVAATLARCAKLHLQTADRLPGHVQLTAWLENARKRLLVTAARLDLPTRDFATTVVFALSDGQSSIVCHVGDGAAVGRCAISGTWVALSWPAAGEYAGTTDFMTDDRPVLRATIVEGGIDRLALFTDGLERLALNFREQTPHPQFFEALDARLPCHHPLGHDVSTSHTLAALLDGEAVCARTDDDKTIIFAALR